MNNSIWSNPMKAFSMKSVATFPLYLTLSILTTLVHAGNDTTVEIGYGESTKTNWVDGALPSVPYRAKLTLGAGRNGLGQGIARGNVELYFPKSDAKDRGSPTIYDRQKEGFVKDLGLSATYDQIEKGGSPIYKNGGTTDRYRVDASLFTIYRWQIYNVRGKLAGEVPRSQILRIETEVAKEEALLKTEKAKILAEIALLKKNENPETREQFEECKKQYKDEAGGENKCLNLPEFSAIALTRTSESRIEKIDADISALSGKKSTQLNTLNEGRNKRPDSMWNISVGSVSAKTEWDRSFERFIPIEGKLDAGKVAFHNAWLANNTINVDVCVVVAPAGLSTGYARWRGEKNLNAKTMYILSAEVCAGIDFNQWVTLRDTAQYELRADMGEDRHTGHVLTNQLGFENILGLPVDLGWRFEYRADTGENGNTQLPMKESITNFIMIGFGK